LEGRGDQTKGGRRLLGGRGPSLTKGHRSRFEAGGRKDKTVRKEKKAGLEICLRGGRGGREGKKSYIYSTENRWEQKNKKKKRKKHNKSINLGWERGVKEKIRKRGDLPNARTDRKISITKSPVTAFYGVLKAV